MEPTAITVQGQSFIDSVGRQVLLHGINLVNKNPKVGYLGNESPEFFGRLRDWGFNCLRLGVIWDGLEPQPGVFNEAYLQGIDRQIDLAHESGLVVFLDMHQDLFSVLFSDGAPAWATLTGDAPHLASAGVWSDAYFSSPAVQAALDSFWDNAPAPDGLGIQEHYAQAWGVLARRYTHHPAVIGYDLMNEPFPGALALQIQETMFSAGATLLAETGNMGAVGSELDGVETLMQQWLTPEGRFELLQVLRNPDLYTAVVDATQPQYNEFERSKLMGMYRRVARAIRAVDAQKILFLETSMGSNMGVFSAIEPLTRADGSRDPYQAYAAHGYDLVTDTENLSQASPERIALIFQRHGHTARRLGMPMLVGEWGAYGAAPGTLAAARQVVGVFEQLLCSETYWAYSSGIETTDSFKAVHRPHVEKIAGTLLNYCYDPQARTFTCAWQEDGAIDAPSRIYLPDWFGFDPEDLNASSDLQLNPWGAGYQILPAQPDSGNSFLEISPIGRPVRREVKIRQVD